MSGPTAQYRGRFAPSPTGPLHLGSLIAAVASYLDARRQAGLWLVRMEDLDPPREEPAAARRILHSLQCHGLYWDDPVMWQGRRDAAYRDSLVRLDNAGALFHCDCTRAMLGPQGACGGRCLPRQQRISSPFSIRIRVPPQCPVEFDDQVQGPQSVDLGQEFPDFVLVRKDALIAYQLAVVVDDAAQGITHVVRGSDLLDSTPRQIFLQGLLGHGSPQYSHFPVITNPQGQKLSKQNHAPALNDEQAAHNLRQALHFLGQAEPPRELDSPARLLEFASRNWSLARIPACLSLPG